MKEKVSAYPFGVVADTKTSKAGKEYLSIGIWQKSKDKDGNKKETFFNCIDERELLVLASVCQMAYIKIMEAKAQEYAKKNNNQQVEETYNNLDDAIPF